MGKIIWDETGVYSVDNAGNRTEDFEKLKERLGKGLKGEKDMSYLALKDEDEFRKESTEVKWDWDTIGPRLLAGVFLVLHENCERDNKLRTDEEVLLSQLREQAVSLLTRTE